MDLHQRPHDFSIRQMKVFSSMNLLSRSETALLTVIVLVLYYGVLEIYRLFFHKLASFPGPKLAALTYWFEFYYDVYPYKHQYAWKIREMHEQYGPSSIPLSAFGVLGSPRFKLTPYIGPVVRINPSILHIYDPDYLDEIWPSSHRKRNRDAWFMSIGKSGPLSLSILQTADHDLHRKRRSVINPLFSKRSIQALERSVVQRRVFNLCDRLAGTHHESTVVNLSHAVTGLTLDVINEYCFGDDSGNLRKAEYGKAYYDFVHEGAQTRAPMRHFPGPFRLFVTAPPWIAKYINPYFVLLDEYNTMLTKKIKAVWAEEGSGRGKSEEGRRTVFHEFRDSNEPPEEKSMDRLLEEANVLLGAGTETTARTICVTAFYLVENPSCLKRLREELWTVMPTPDADVNLSKLESLPYLSAVVNEGLRTAHAVSTRMPRVATQEDLVYKQWTIPRGTPICQSGYLHHTNPSIFPEPLTFQPERWIKDPGLSKYQMAFGRGSRICLGMQ